MRLERDDAGDLWLRGLAPLHVDTLIRVPDWLQSDDERVRQRLLPPAYGDEVEAEQWARFTTPELEHLFASRGQLVRRDLQSLAPDERGTFKVRVRRAHGGAWLSALNGARLALFVLHHLRAEDMEADPADLDDFEAELALIRIHIMAFVQELLIEAGV